jgi:hypothetical protein
MIKTVSNVYNIGCGIPRKGFFPKNRGKLSILQKHKTGKPKSKNSTILVLYCVSFSLL